MQYEKLCEAYKRIEATSKRLEKTAHIAQLLEESGEDLERVLLLLQGRLFAGWDKQKIGASGKVMFKALVRVTGLPSRELEEAWSKTGDLGLVAQQHIGSKQQQTLLSSSLTVEEVHTKLQKLASTEGKGSVGTKIQIIGQLLSQASPLEAKYLTRTVLEELRIGIASGTLRDGIIYAFLAKQAGIEEGSIEDREAYNSVSEAVQGAIDRTNDFASVARTAQEGLEALKKIEARTGTPLKVMLGERGTTVQDAMERLGKPILLQHKYDGFRVEIHKEGEDISIFTRRLEDVTEQFPDIVAIARKSIKVKQCILDGEAIGIDEKTGAHKPFQEISQRIRRKHGIQEMAEKLPVDVRIFDIIMLEGKEVLDEPMRERHALLETHLEEQERFGIAKTLITEDPQEGEEFYADALREGLEGVFAKNMESTYQPGVRVGNWIKIKNVMDPVDAVVVAAEWGEGKRSGWLTSYTLAIIDENGDLAEVGKAGTGLKEKPEEGFSFPEITKMLEPLITYEEGKEVRVKPEIILEVAYEEIQKSPKYASGYALRFPRVLRNRTDERDVDDATTLKEVKQLYDAQRGGAHQRP